MDNGCRYKEGDSIIWDPTIDANVQIQELGPGPFVVLSVFPPHLMGADRASVNKLAYRRNLDSEAPPSTIPEQVTFMAKNKTQVFAASWFVPA